MPRSFSELGPISQAIMTYIQDRPWYIEFFRMIHAVHTKTGAKHSPKWYRTQLVALALEGRIEAKVQRTGDKVAIRFRQLQEDDG